MDYNLMDKAIFGKHVYLSKSAIVIEILTRAVTVQTMAYSENNMLSRQLHTVKTVANY